MISTTYCHSPIGWIEIQASNDAVTSVIVCDAGGVKRKKWLLAYEAKVLRNMGQSASGTLFFLSVKKLNLEL